MSFATTAHEKPPPPPLRYSSSTSSGMHAATVELKPREPFGGANSGDVAASGRVFGGSSTFAFNGGANFGNASGGKKPKKEKSKTTFGVSKSAFEYFRFLFIFYTANSGKKEKERANDKPIISLPSDFQHTVHVRARKFGV